MSSKDFYLNLKLSNEFILNFFKRLLPNPYDQSIAFSSLLAVGTGSVVANLGQVPNQPVIFKVVNKKIQILNNLLCN